MTSGDDELRRLAGRVDELEHRLGVVEDTEAVHRLLDHPQLQGVVHVAPDRCTARGRFRSLMQTGTHETQPGTRQWWEGGLYENTYVREGGQWKIQVLNLRQVWVASFEEGWAHSPVEYDGYLAETYPDDPFGPDEVVSNWSMWPDTTTFPFHYNHPLTGEEVR